MKPKRNFGLIKLVLLAIAFSWLNNGQGLISEDRGESPILARIDMPAISAGPKLPVYAHLTDSSGNDYALVIAHPSQLDRSGFVYHILDRNTGEANYFILGHLAGVRQTMPVELVKILHDDGEQLIVRSTFRQVEQLAASGFEAKWLGRTPMVLKAVPQPPASVQSVEYDEAIAGMIAQVTPDLVETYAGNLSGENVVNISGAYTITTRYTDSGTPIAKATQYVYEFMQDLGLTVSYHDWEAFDYSGRNVIGELPGTFLADQIVLVTAHLDCLPSTGIAPGADDNATGAVGVMVSAQLLSQHLFKRTLRFIFFTGEEQGLIGSYEYADLIYQNGDNIIGAYNMDMIGFDLLEGPDLRLHTRTALNPGYSGDLSIATTFVDVLNFYGLSDKLTPIIDADGLILSDHSAFWSKGYAAVLAIEDHENDMTPCYHTLFDTVSNLNLTYFTNFVKASVGTAAHLAIMDYGTVFADFTASPTSGTAPLTVNFSDLSSDNPDTWNWVFEGGTPASSDEQNPVVTYNTPGTYTVSLTASNSDSQDIEAKFDYITVIPAPCPGAIANPGFETGTTSDWTSRGEIDLTSDAHSGSYAAQLTHSGSSLEQVVTGICPNTTYTVSCWGKAKGSAGLFLGVKNYGGNELTVQFQDQRNFVQQSITFTTGAANSSATLFVIKTGSNFDGTADDFTLVEDYKY